MKQSPTIQVQNRRSPTRYRVDLRPYLPDFDPYAARVVDDLMLDRSLTASRLSIDSGLTVNTIYKFLTRPFSVRPTSFASILFALGVTPEYLVHESLLRWTLIEYSSRLAKESKRVQKQQAVFAAEKTTPDHYPPDLKRIEQAPTLHTDGTVILPKFIFGEMSSVKEGNMYWKRGFVTQVTTQAAHEAFWADRPIPSPLNKDLVACRLLAQWFSDGYPAKESRKVLSPSLLRMFLQGQAVMDKLQPEETTDANNPQTSPDPVRETTAPDS